MTEVKDKKTGDLRLVLAGTGGRGNRQSFIDFMRAKAGVAERLKQSEPAAIADAA